MKMPRVDNFLGCMELETGGLVIVNVNMVFNIIAFIVSVVFLVSACKINCDVDLVDSETCATGRVSVFGIAIFVIILTIIVGAIGYFCIKGINNKNHNHVKPMMILLAVCVVLSLLEILLMSAGALVSGLVKVLLYGYQFIVMYSIYSLFEEEYERRLTPQYQAPNDKVESITHIE